MQSWLPYEPYNFLRHNGILALRNGQQREWQLKQQLKRFSLCVQSSNFNYVERTIMKFSWMAQFRCVARNRGWLETPSASLTCFTSESPVQAGRLPHQLWSALKLKSIMPQPHQTLSHSDKADIQLTILSLNRYQIKTIWAATQAFNVPRTTLRDWRASKPPRRDCQPNSKKLT